MSVVCTQDVGCWDSLTGEYLGEQPAAAPAVITNPGIALYPLAPGSHVATDPSGRPRNPGPEAPIPGDNGTAQRV